MRFRVSAFALTAFALAFGVLVSLGAVPAVPATPPHETVLSVAGRVNATPWMVADGRFIAVAWGATTADGKTDVFLSTSRNNGVTFGAPQQVNTQAGEARLGGEMPPRVAIAKSASYGGPDVAVLWTARGAAADATAIKLTRSRDGGHFFSAPVALQTADAAGNRGWPALTLDDRGVAHAIWLDHRGLAGMPHAKHEPGMKHDAGMTHDGVAMAQRSGLFYAAAQPLADQNAPVSTVPERELTKGVCYCCKTSLVAGRDGALFAAWREVYDGDIRDIAFSVSRDGGRTFSEPTRISHDRWAINGCPDDGPAMTVDATGLVHIIWPTVVTEHTIPDDSTQGALFYTSTRDGKTFAPRTHIPTLGSTKPSHPQIAIDRSGRLVVAWDEVKGGHRVAAVRELKPAATAENAANTPNSVTFGPIVTLGNGDPGVYPVLAATTDGLMAAWTSTANNASVIKLVRVDLPTTR